MVATLSLELGRIICEDVTSQGQVIVKKNTKVDQRVLEKLQMFKIMGVNCYEPADFAVSYYEKVSLSKEFKAYSERYRTALIAYKVAVDSFVFNKIPFRKIDLLAIANELYPDNLSPKQLLTYLNLLVPSEEELPFAHGLNSGLICKVLGKWLGYKDENLDELVFAGFIYDVGKNLLPSDIIWKPARLNNMEMDLVKTHPFYGFHMLSKTRLDPRVLSAVLQHHERCDGSGYPQGLVAKDISDFAKIIAIVDMYEAMTAPRSYRPAMCPYKAIGIFEKEFFQKYDIRIIQTFMGHLSDELIGSRVRLNTGDEGEVIMTNRTSYSRPVVQMDDGVTIDMSQYPSMSIEAII